MLTGFAYTVMSGTCKHEASMRHCVCTVFLKMLHKACRGSERMLHRACKYAAQGLQLAHMLHMACKYDAQGFSKYDARRLQICCTGSATILHRATGTRQM